MERLRQEATATAILSGSATMTHRGQRNGDSGQRLSRAGSRA